MPAQVRKGGVWNQIVSAKVFANGAWRDLVAIRIYAGGAWRLVANFTPPSPPPPSGGGGGGGGGGTMTLSASPTTDLAIGSTTIVISDSITATPSGGLAPYTYSWSVVTQDAGPTITFIGGTHATASVKANGIALNTSKNCTVHCVATDSLGVTATSNTVSITFRNAGGTA